MPSEVIIALLVLQAVTLFIAVGVCVKVFSQFKYNQETQHGFLKVIVERINTNTTQLKKIKKTVKELHQSTTQSIFNDIDGLNTVSQDTTLDDLLADIQPKKKPKPAKPEKRIPKII